MEDMKKEPTVDQEVEVIEKETFKEMSPFRFLRQKIWVPSLGQEDSLEEEMATHSSILARKIPWMYSPWED